MKEVNSLYVKIIPVFILLILFSFVIILKREDVFSQMTFSNQNKVDIKVEEILKANEDKELIANESFKNRFVYVAFQKESEFTSYFVDKETGEEKDFLAYLKSGCEDEFLAKEKELLYLKYPMFLADALSREEVVKTYQVLESELVIHYNHYALDFPLSEAPFLRISYTEIQNYLDIPIEVNGEHENENGYTLDKNKKAIALTFDDGPSGEKTNRLVNILEQNKAHATFFMVGSRMEAGASVIRNVLNKGNEIGSHSYAHKNMKRQKLEDVISGEEKTKEIYRNVTGQELIYTRPPYGNVTKAIKENLNTVFVTWNIDTEDWLHRDKNYIVNHIMENVSDGDIILMHDIYDTTIDAVEELLPKLYAEGYQVVTISELASLKGITLETHSLYRSLKEVQ